MLAVRRAKHVPLPAPVPPVTSPGLCVNKARYWSTRGNEPRRRWATCVCVCVAGALVAGSSACGVGGRPRRARRGGGALLLLLCWLPMRWKIRPVRRPLLGCPHPH